MSKLTSHLFIVLFLAAVLFVRTAHAQVTKSVQLKPIFKEGRKYFYSTKKMNSAYSLQIPLESLEDKEIDRYFNRFKNFQRARFFMYVPSYVFLFTSTGHGSQSAADTFLLLLLGGLAGDITCGTIAHRQMGKAIDLYNIAITERSSIGLRLDKISDSNTMLSFGLRKKF